MAELLSRWHVAAVALLQALACCGAVELAGKAWPAAAGNQITKLLPM